MKNLNYFNLNQIKSNPDGQTTVKRQSRVMSQSGCSAVDVPMTSYGAPDEHPMSTRSASDGTRWNSRGWKYVAMIFAVLVMSIANIGMAWGAETSMPTSGSYSTNTKYAFSNSAVTGSSFYLAQRGSISRSSDYGWQPNNTGIALQVSSPVSLTFTIKSNTTSSRTITGQAYAVTDPFFNIYKNTTAGSQTLEDYVKAVNAKSAGSRSSEEAAIAAVSAFAAITGSADANKKLLICENPGAFSEAVAHGAAISHACPTTKGETNTFTVSLSAAGKYVIYLTSSGGSVGITKINIVPRKTIYMVPGDWNGDTPKFFVHSWGDFNDDVLMTLANCETNVFKADIPTNNTNLLFTRQNPSSTEIKYKDQDGNWNQSANYSIGSNNQFTFSGTWSDGEGKSTFNAGTYSAPTFTVTYDANGGTGSVPVDGSSPYSCGSNVTILGNTGSLAKAGKAFDGWNTASGGGGTSYTEGSILSNITGDVTLFAKWVTAYSVTYNANGGSGSVPSDATPYVNGATVTVLGRNTLTKSDYVFAGWNTKSDGSGTWYIPTETFSMGTKNVTLYAQWATCISTTDFAALSDAMGTRSLDNTKSSLTSNNIKHSLGGDTRYDNSSGYHGLKLKHTGDWIGFGVAAGNTVTIKTETVGASPEVTIDFESAATLPANTDKAYEESGSARYFRIKSTDGSKAVVINKITIGTASCTAPTGLTAASTTAKGTTFTITDAANTNDYEIVCKTTSGTPAADATPTYTSTDKTKAVTDLVAGTKYYAWVRSKCSASNKSDWVSGGNFTTSTVTVTHTLTNVSKTSGGETAGGSDYTAVYAADAEYSMPTPTVTIDGNTATSGTDYTWSSGTLTIPANKINGNIVITLNSVPSAPSSATISGTYHYFPGDNISLTCTPTGNNGPTTYQWYKGGKADGNAIDGATSATYTKNSCAFADAGSYYCKVTCNATSIWANTNSSENYDVKILRLYVNGSKSVDPYGNVDFVKVDGTTATASISLGSNWTYGFNIADGCGHYYGNAGTMTKNNCGPWVTNVNGTDCGLTTTNAATYIFTINYSNLSSITTTVTYPSANQASGKVIYFDNNVLKWTGSSIYYRIGHSSHSQADQLSLVPGTANLYKMTTREYNGFSAWQIGNAEGGNGSDKSIYNTKNSPAITASIAYEGGAVTAAAVTVTPGADHSTGGDAQNNNCEFYSKTITNGMKKDRVTISDYSNGTITVNYTNTSNVASTLTSGYADLAHTVILTSITAEANTGYDAGAITINGGAYSANYVVTGATTIAATFTPQVYSITYKDQGGADFSGEHADGYPTTHTYGSSTVLKGATKAGYIFGGWFGNSACTGAAMTSIGATSITAGIILYAKWTAVASLTAISADELYQAASMANITFTESDQNFTGLSTNNLFKVYGTDGNAAKGKNENHDVTDDISEKNFTSALYILSSSNTTSTDDPTQGAIEIITPSTAGLLYLYLDANNSSLTLKKQGTSTSESLSGAAYKAMEVDANTHYFINGSTSGKRGLYGIQYVSTYGVTITPTNVTQETGDETAIKGKAYTATFTAPVGYTLPSDVTSLTIGGVAQTKGSGYTWTVSSGTGTLTVPAAKVTGNIVVSVAGAAAVTHDVTFSLTNVVYSSGDDEGDDAATEGVEFSTVFAASSGYSLPGTITVTIGGVTQTAGTGYTWYQGTGTLTIPAAYVTDDIVVTIAGEELEGDGCEELVHTQAASATTLNTTVGTATLNSPSSQSNTNKAVKLDSSGNIELSPKAGKSFAANDSIIVVLWNQASSAKTSGYKIGGTDYTESIPSRVNYTFRRKLAAADIVDGKVTLKRESSNGSNVYFVSIIIKHCEDMESCTTPTLPMLSNQTVCPGSDIAAWNATVTNASTISDAGESVAYSWKKKGNDTEIEDEATLDLGSSATEGQAGTYVVTATVSKTGRISKSASKEVTLTVTPATETPSVTASKATVYPGNSVTLTATCGTAGVTWNWYLCANADGTGAGSSLGTSSSYTIASAPAAGTYYYKVKATGDGTNACGTAEYVYTLTVSAASECENYYWFVYADDATANGVVNNRDDFFSNATSGSGNAGTYTITIDEVDYTATKRLGAGAYKPKFTVPESKTATLYVYGKANSADAGKHLVIKRTSDETVMEVTDNNTDAAYSLANIPAGEWTLSCGSNNWRYSVIAVKLCGASSCTDATPTIAAANTTVCSGSELSITATGYETSPTSIQWQKLNSSTSAWDNISGATEATYSVASAAAEHAGSYRCVVTKGCARTSNTVTITIQSAPVFGDVPSSVTVMQTIALSISTVEASDAASYKWYKSANSTWDESDPEIGTSKNLIKAYADEATGSPSYYVICRATNSCGITTSSAIAVNVTAYVAEDCADNGNEGEAEFDFENTSMSSGSYNNETAWSGNSNSKYLTYIAPTGKNFATAKVTIATSGGSNAAYAVYNGSSWTYYNITEMSSSWQEKSIDLPANTTKFQIGRRLGDKGTSSGTFYLHEACFTYTETCTATTITVSGTGSETHTIGDSFTEPTFTVKHGGTAFDPQPEITYTSSNEDIATVDDDGTVNFQGMAGSVTITAAYAGDATYCASEGHYTITVSCSDDEPKIVAASSVDLSGCNSSVVLNAKKQDGTAFAGGTYQWYRDGEAISGATSASYTAVQAGVYTVERTNSGCTNLSSNSATVTSATVEPEVERLVPFQYYHVDKTYSNFMKMRHLFTVKGSAAYGSTGKNFKMELSKNGAAATDVTTSNAFSVVKSADNTVDTVMIDLNKLNGKYAKDDELVLTCKAVDCEGNVSSTYKDEITIHVIDATPTMALILNGKESVVGGDFLEDYEPKNLQEQTGSKTWSGEWPMYTDLKTEYIVTPVNGYAPFNKLNYEPFDIIFLTDFPKASKSDAAATILDDMAALCDYRPLFSFKTHMVHKSPSKWAAKGFTTSPTENKGDGRTYLNIVCYAHPMFADIKTGDEVYTDASDGSQLVYMMLSGTGYEKSKGMQGFEIDAAENFVTIGLTHYNASVATAAGVATWTPGDGDRMLVSSAERQANPEARMILLSLNAGAHSKLTEKGRAVVMKSLEYLIQTSGGLIEPADCSYTFDNAAGDNNWNTAGNWGPRHNAVPGAFTSARIAAPAVVNIEHAVAMEVRIVEGGSITIPAGKGLEVKSTIRHMDGAEISPTEISELTLEASSSSNGTLIFNNNSGDTKARVDMYSNAKADVENMSAATSTWQYIGTPHSDVANARYNYYNSWLYQYSGSGWEVIPNGGPLVPFRGYCVTHPDAPVVFDMAGTLVATTAQDIAIHAGYTVIANSWTAPIDISTFTDDDMENISDKTIYFFNTGSDAEGTAGTGTEAGTYVAVPKNSASYVGTWQIPSMQGFYISTTSAGTLHLDYDRHVRPTGGRTIVSSPMYAPRRAKAAEEEEPAVLKIFARGSRYQDKLVVLEREDFTRGYDSGWDGEAWGGGTLSPMVYVTGEGREDAVSAIPEFEGTVIAFKAGEDEAYTLHFEYLNSDEPLYLLDTENNTYTQVMTGNAYYFTTTDKAAHSRFVLTRKSPQIATGVGEVPSDQVQGTKAKKLLIEDKMFIIVNGMLYDATGKAVK